MATTKGAKADEVKEEVKPEVPTNVHPSTLKASQNGTPIEEYARRLLASQGVDLAITFKLAMVEKGLLGQEYDFKDIGPVLKKLQEELI